MANLLTRLDREKFEHVVVCPAPNNGRCNELFDTDRHRVVSMSLRPFNPFSFCRMIRLLNVEPFDLIHSHGKAAGLYSRFLGKIFKTPVIHHFHGLHYRQYPRLIQKLYLWLERRLSNWTDTAICVSHSERDEGYSHKLFASNKVRVVLNGIDTEKFKADRSLAATIRERMKIPLDAKVITTVTRDCFQKNLDLSIGVHEKVCEQIPNTYLVIVGVYRDHHRVFDDGHCSSCSDRIVVVERESEVSGILNMSDIYLNTSRWEGLSLAVIEAMASELPVVLSDVVGNRDFYRQDGLSVYLIKEDNIQQFANTIVELLSCPDRAAAIGKALRQQVVKQFNLNDNARKIEEIYQDCISESTGSKH